MAEGMMPEILTGTFKGFDRLDLCLLNFIARAERGALFGWWSEERDRLRKLRTLTPPLVERRFGLAEMDFTYMATDAGRKVMSEFGHNPHFEWVEVPGVVGVGNVDLARWSAWTARATD